MKGKILFSALLILAITDNTALALSHRHAASLEARGCTQVEELNGTCSNARHFQTHKRVSEADAMQAARDWDAQHSAEQAPVVKHSSKYPLCADLPVDASNWDRKNCIE